MHVVPTDQAKGTLQIAYTEQRFSEANRMLADQASVTGLAYVDSQVNTTKQAILATNDPVVKQQLAQKYIADLQTESTQLEQQKQLAQTVTPAPTPIPTPTPSPMPPVVTSQPKVVILTPTLTPTPTPSPTPQPVTTAVSATTSPDVVGSIDKTQQNINQAISE